MPALQAKNGGKISAVGGKEKEEKMWRSHKNKMIFL
jgi:hypothetical protein